MTKSKKIKPLRNNVLIEVLDEAEQKTASGIIIPDSAKETPTTGKVEAVGEMVTEVKPGDTVMYKKWGGIEIADSGKLYLLIEDEDILALV